MALSSLLRTKSATVSVALENKSSSLFVHPSVDEPSRVRGTVTLFLPRRKAVKSVAITIQESCNSHGGYGWPYEMTTVMIKELSVDVNATLEAGEHQFRFSCTIPSDTATVQKCAYGRVVHWLKCSVHYSSLIALPTTSRLVSLSILANPDAPGEIPKPLDTHIEHFTEELGPLAVSFTSPQLTVSSLVNVQVTFMAPFHAVTIFSIHPFITEAFTISYDASKKVSRPLAVRIPLPIIQSDTESLTISRTSSSDSGRSRDLERVDPTPLALLHPEMEYVWKRLLRVPREDVIKASTHPSTKTKLRVLHGLHVEIKFRLEGEVEMRSIVVGSKAPISSCCCLLEAMLLPPYTPDPPLPAGPSRPPGVSCLCNMSYEEMVEREGPVGGTSDPASSVPEQWEREPARDRKSPVGHLR